MTQKNLFKKLKKQISKMDIAIPGTVRVIYLRCGRKNCRCHSQKKTQKHGPYYFWDRKIDEKLTSSSIPKENLQKFKHWIKNRRKLEKLIRQVLHYGQQIAIKMSSK